MELNLSNPSNASVIHHIRGAGSWTRPDAGQITNTYVSGVWNTAGAITGFTFGFLTGNIASGTIRVYGIT